MYYLEAPPGLLTPIFFPHAFKQLPVSFLLCYCCTVHSCFPALFSPALGFVCCSPGTGRSFLVRPLALTSNTVHPDHYLTDKAKNHSSDLIRLHSHSNLIWLMTLKPKCLYEDTGNGHIMFVDIIWACSAGSTKTVRGYCGWVCTQPAPFFTNTDMTAWFLLRLSCSCRKPHKAAVASISLPVWGCVAVFAIIYIFFQFVETCVYCMNGDTVQYYADLRHTLS